MDLSAIQSVLQGIDFEPRPYQLRIIEKCVNMFLGEHRSGCGEIEPPARSVMIESPTGSGKTCIGLVVAKVLQRLTGARVGWVAMRENLLAQARSEEVARGINLEAVSYISMFQKAPPSEIDLLVIDEAQHDASSSCTHIHNVIKPKWILGLTATPFRSDKVKLCFDKVVKDAGIHQLIHDGYLSQFDHFTIPKWEVASLADHYSAELERWGKSIFFFHKSEECFQLNRIMRDRGITSDVVTGQSDRDAQLTAFRRGELQVLINCMVLTEGFDDPSLQTAWIRPSAKGPTIQMAGRALRKHADIRLKRIVQCSQTPHPFVRTATPLQQHLWHQDGWRTLRINPKIDLCSHNTCRIIAQTSITLPKFLSKKQQNRQRRVASQTH